MDISVKMYLPVRCTDQLTRQVDKNYIMQELSCRLKVAPTKSTGKSTYSTLGKLKLGHIKKTGFLWEKFK